MSIIIYFAKTPIYYYVKYTGLVIRIIKDCNTWKCIYRNI